jgi:hypothetical protein
MSGLYNTQTKEGGKKIRKNKRHARIKEAGTKERQS